jgi:arginyl-tRNA synthetase
MPTIASHLTALVEVAARRAGLAEEGAIIESCIPTKDPAHGDYQSNAAFRLAKTARRPPDQVVALLQEHFPSDPAVARVEIAGKGFLNLTLTDDWLAADLTARAADERLGAPEPGAGKTLVLDYSSPNIAKRMHVGHLRSTLIGGAFDRIFRFLGWRVIADNHLGDWGTPYGKLMVAWKEWLDEAAYREDPIGELDRLYRLFGERSQDDPDLLARARQETVKLQNREPATLALWQEFVDRTMVELRSIYERLGCRFDVFLGESAYADALSPLLAELESKGFAEHSKGGLIVRFEEAEGKGLSEQPLLVRKADGAALYSTTDLATIRHRVQTWSPQRAVYVVDARQSLHFRQVFAAARKTGLAPSDLELVHVGFGILRLPGGAIVSSRKATPAEAQEAGEAKGEQSVNLVDVLDTAAQRAYEVVTEKNPELPEDERRKIAEVVGVGTIKYFDLSQNPQSDITFSWERALSLDGGSAVYLQYAYARMHSILRKGGVADTLPTAPASVSHPAERALAVLVARTPEVVIAAAEAYRPNLLADHLDALVQAVGRFYESCPVLRDDVPADLRLRRLSLVYTVAHTLRIGLSLLGIGVVPRM